MGYGWVQIGMTQQLLTLPLWIVLLLPFAKILATGLSIGSGGSGGIFGPGMVIGGMLGASFWRLSYGVLPQVPSSPAPFVIIGMMALFGGIAHAPLAVMLMVAEMTGNLSLLAPAMVAVAISTALVGNNTIYRSQLPDRAHAPAHRMRFSFPLLAALLVRDTMRPAQPVVQADTAIRDAAALLDRDGAAGLIVLDARGELYGVLTRAQLQQAPAEQGGQPVRTFATTDVLALAPDQTLDTAMGQLAERSVSWAPVVEGRRVLGRVRVRDIMQTYKATLGRSVRRATALPPETVLFEVRIGATSPLAGRALREAGLPPKTLVVSVGHEGEVIFPRATTRLEVGDVVQIMAEPESEPALRTFLEGTLLVPTPVPPGPGTTAPDR
jgi:CIC family chloride channel protein